VSSKSGDPMKSILTAVLLSVCLAGCCHNYCAPSGYAGSCNPYQGCGLTGLFGSYGCSANCSTGYCNHGCNANAGFVPEQFAPPPVGCPVQQVCHTAPACDCNPTSCEVPVGCDVAPACGCPTVTDCDCAAPVCSDSCDGYGCKHKKSSCFDKMKRWWKSRHSCNCKNCQQTVAAEPYECPACLSAREAEVDSEIIEGEVISGHPGEMHIEQLEPYDELPMHVPAEQNLAFPRPAPPISPDMDESGGTFEKPVPAQPDTELQGALLIVPDAPNPLPAGWEKTQY